MSKQQPKAKVLRIGLFQNNRIIEERLLRAPRPVTIGSDFKRNTFVVPASDLPKTQTVFDVKNGQYILNITKGMTGRVKIGDSIDTLQDLIQKGKAQKSGTGYAIALEQNAQGRVAIGEATLLFQFVTPPPPRPKPVLPASMRGGWVQGLDKILVLSTSITAILLIGFVAFLELQEWPEPLESKQIITDKFVQILVEDTEEPTPVEPVETAEDGEGEPVEEAAPEPAPSKDPPKEEPKEEEAGGDEKAGDEKSADELAKLEAERKRRLAEEVQNKTILGQIGSVSTDGSSGGLVDVLSEGAGRTSMDDAFAGSTGIKTGVVGAEKSGLRSSGSADGDGTGGAVGVGDIGPSKGAKEAGKGVKTVEKQAAKVKANVRIKGPTQTVGGKLDANDISKKLKLKQSQFQKCYERELKKNPKAGGKVVVVFVIGSAGRVTSAKATADSVGGGVGSCIADTIGRIRFGRPQGGDVTVSKSFVFSSGG